MDGSLRAGWVRMELPVTLEASWGQGDKGGRRRQKAFCAGRTAAATHGARHGGSYPQDDVCIHAVCPLSLALSVARSLHPQQINHCHIS